ncbi:MAG: hypothetical protein IJF75_01235 [Clostridia bacterium]|nr:hypothetical protein [Clostridia bacterium]
MKYRICDIVVEIKTKSEKVIKYFSDYLYSDNLNAELVIEYSSDEISDFAKSKGVSAWIAEITMILRDFSNFAIKERSAILFHSSAICVKNQAILFCAPSGTGKSTHSKLWIKNFSDVEYINDDKPFIRKKGDDYFVYGSPWRGKHNLGNNISAKIKAICFIERASENSIEEINALKAISGLVNQSVRVREENDIDKLLQVFREVITTTKIYKLRVNMKDDAPISARKVILGDI